MKPLELANRYLEIFYSGKKIQDLSQLFTNDLKFTGPFYTFDTSEAYVNSLLSSLCFLVASEFIVKAVEYPQKLLKIGKEEVIALVRKLSNYLVDFL